MVLHNLPICLKYSSKIKSTLQSNYSMETNPFEQNCDFKSCRDVIEDEEEEKEEDEEEEENEEE